ncbi:MAG: response regulator [Deltaproteobacteria bacterium]|nr:response regulator [Deltaproteobacteria bacterium]
MPPTDEDAPRGRILVVDDQEDVCWVVAKLLSARGHETRTAGSGASALKVVAGFECQVALVDYRLPDGSGLALIRELTSRWPRLRSILMTSYGSAALRQQVTDENLFAYFDKPFNNDLIVGAVEDAIRAWEAGDDSLAAGARARTRFPGRAPSESLP